MTIFLSLFINLNSYSIHQTITRYLQTIEILHSTIVSISLEHSQVHPNYFNKNHNIVKHTQLWGMIIYHRLQPIYCHNLAYKVLHKIYLPLFPHILVLPLTNILIFYYPIFSTRSVPLKIIFICSQYF